MTQEISAQKIITKYNVSIDTEAINYFHIVDPRKSVMTIVDVYKAVNQIIQTTVRNLVGQFTLDQLLSKTVDINDKIKNMIDAHTEPWGLRLVLLRPKILIYRIICNKQWPMKPRRNVKDEQKLLMRRENTRQLRN